jgi:hypothetical protein
MVMAPGYGTIGAGDGRGLRGTMARSALGAGVLAAFALCTFALIVSYTSTEGPTELMWAKVRNNRRIGFAPMQPKFAVASGHALWEMKDLPDEPFGPEGPLGSYPVDDNLEGELSIFPVSTDKEGPRRHLRASTCMTFLSMQSKKKPQTLSHHTHAHLAVHAQTYTDEQLQTEKTTDNNPKP